eukprot:32878_1
MLHHSRASMKLNCCQKFQKKKHTNVNNLWINKLLHSRGTDKQSLSHHHLLSTETQINNKCNRCGKIGHWAGECDQQRNDRKYVNINDKCNRCGKTGHWARECDQPYNKKYIKYPSVSSAQKYGKIDAQIALSTAKSYYPIYSKKQSSQSNNYESQLIEFIQSNQFNNAINIFHIMMQQQIKLTNKSIFSSILKSLQRSNKHNFHILELIDYMKYNNIQLNENKFAEILGICISKNDEYSAKQIAILWFETMPNLEQILPS